MGGNEDCLIEMRLGFTHNIKMEEEEEEDEEDGEITTPAHSFHSLIMQSAPVLNFQILRSFLFNF